MAKPEEPAEQIVGLLVEETQRQLMGMMERGTLRPGQKLGAERELALKLGVSRSTLRLALKSLEDRGLIRRVPGRGGGTFVAAAKLERDLSRIVGIPTLLMDQGFTAGSRVISVGVELANADAADALNIKRSEFIVSVIRIRFADGMPISLEHAMLPADLVPGLPERQLTGSLYELLEREYGIKPEEAIEHLEVVLAGEPEAEILGIAPGAPLLAVSRISKNAAGVAIEYSHDLFRADRTRITVRTHGNSGGDDLNFKERKVELTR